MLILSLGLHGGNYKSKRAAMKKYILKFKKTKGGVLAECGRQD